MDPKERLERLGQLNADARKIIDDADEKAGGNKQAELTAEESAKVDEINAEYDRVKAEGEKEEKQNAQRKRLEKHEQYMEESAGRQTNPDSGRNAGLDSRPQQGGVPLRGNDGGRGNDGDAPHQLELHGRPINLRPGTPEHTRACDPYRQAFAEFLYHGIHAGLQTADKSKGGYLAPTQTSLELIKALDDAVFMRQLATVLPPLTSAISLGIPSFDTDLADATWTAEVPASDMSEDDSMRFGQRELTPHMLAKLVKVSTTLLRVGVMNPEALVRERLAYMLGVTEEKAFLTGDGADQPLGVFTPSDDGIPTSRNVTAAAVNKFTADELVEMLYSLKAQYQARATWIWHRDAVSRIRKFKDGNGQYLWEPGLTGGQPATILARPFVMSEFAPNTFTTAKYVGIIGDFKNYYIVDSLQLEIQRIAELFILKNQVGFLCRKSADGMPVLGEAFARLILG